MRSPSLSGESFDNFRRIFEKNRGRGGDGAKEVLEYLLAVGFVIGGYFGSHLAVKIDKELLKKIFAIILFYTAFKLLSWDEVVVRWIKNIF